MKHQPQFSMRAFWAFYGSEVGYAIANLLVAVAIWAGGFSHLIWIAVGYTCGVYSALIAAKVAYTYWDLSGRCQFGDYLVSAPFKMVRSDGRSVTNNIPGLQDYIDARDVLESYAPKNEEESELVRKAAVDLTWIGELGGRGGELDRILPSHFSDAHARICGALSRARRDERPRLLSMYRSAHRWGL
ncbi:MAG: hypothetical protein HQK66_11410 [Desulfamplus sp.]|nr:hypothetical protein [Desulfamplus sp.]